MCNAVQCSVRPDDFAFHGASLCDGLVFAGVILAGTKRNGGDKRVGGSEGEESKKGNEQERR